MAWHSSVPITGGSPGHRAQATQMEATTKWRQEFCRHQSFNDQTRLILGKSSSNHPSCSPLSNLWRWLHPTPGPVCRWEICDCRHWNIWDRQLTDLACQSQQSFQYVRGSLLAGEFIRRHSVFIQDCGPYPAVVVVAPFLQFHHQPTTTI